MDTAAIAGVLLLFPGLKAGLFALAVLLWKRCRKLHTRPKIRKLYLIYRQTHNLKGR